MIASLIDSLAPTTSRTWTPKLCSSVASCKAGLKLMDDNDGSDGGDDDDDDDDDDDNQDASHQQNQSHALQVLGQASRDEDHENLVSMPKNVRRSGSEELRELVVWICKARLDRRRLGCIQGMASLVTRQQSPSQPMSSRSF